MLTVFLFVIVRCSSGRLWTVLWIFVYNERRVVYWPAERLRLPLMKHKERNIVYQRYALPVMW